ncbi:MAG: hypothetical protein ACRELF_27060 [Gemmataceae bacterium]
MAVGVDHLFALMGLQFAEFGDFAVLDSDVSAIARQAGAVDHNAATNYGIKLRHD